MPSRKRWDGESMENRGLVSIYKLFISPQSASVITIPTLSDPGQMKSENILLYYDFNLVDF